MKRPTNLEMLCMAQSGLSPEQVRTMDCYLIGYISLSADPELWEKAVEQSKTFATEKR
jgi:hypothetical protein